MEMFNLPELFRSEYLNSVVSLLELRVFVMDEEKIRLTYSQDIYYLVVNVIWLGGHYFFFFYIVHRYNIWILFITKLHWHVFSNPNYQIASTNSHKKREEKRDKRHTWHPTKWDTNITFSSEHSTCFNNNNKALDNTNVLAFTIKKN